MKILGIITCLALATSLTAFADDAPTLTVQSGSASIDISLLSEGNGIWGITAPISETLSNGTSFTLNNVTFDIDPSVHYAIGVTNNDSATGFTPYTFTFSTPTTLASGQYSVSSSLAGSLTDGGTNGVTLQPIGSSYVQQSFIGASNAGVDLLNTPINQIWTPFSQPFGPLTASSTYFLGTTASQISVTTNFELSDNDSASLSGRFDVSVNAVPEPSSVAMAFIAAGAFVVLIVRRRSSQARA